MIKVFTIFVFVLFLTAEAYSYSSFVIEPLCWNFKKCGPPQDRTYDISCPVNHKGEGYCNKKFKNRYFTYFYSVADNDGLVRFHPKIIFKNKMGKVVYRYDSSGVFYKGKKVCNVTKDFGIPYVGKVGRVPYVAVDGVMPTAEGDGTMPDVRVTERQKPCPLFLDGPIRYLENSSNISSGAVVSFDGFDGKSWWTEYKGERLNFVVPKRRFEVSARSKKLADQVRKRWPEIDELAVSFAADLKKKGLKSFVSEYNISLRISQEDRENFPKLTKELLFKLYQESPYLQKILNNCVGEIDEYYFEGRNKHIVNYFNNKTLSPVIQNHVLFTLKDFPPRLPLRLGCSLERFGKKWKPSIYFSPHKSSDYIHSIELWAK